MRAARQQKCRSFVAAVHCRSGHWPAAFPSAAGCFAWMSAGARRLAASANQTLFPIIPHLIMLPTTLIIHQLAAAALLLPADPCLATTRDERQPRQSSSRRGRPVVRACWWLPAA